MRRFLPILLLLFATPLAARDSLGVFGQWGAFRDAEVPRCYAIAAAQPTRSEPQKDGYATVSTWPERRVRGQVHFRLSRPLAEGRTPTLSIGTERFELTGADRDSWAIDQQGDARIVAAMRAASTMRIDARDAQGRNFTDSYQLEGVATALDAATLGCARGG